MRTSGITRRQFLVQMGVAAAGGALAACSAPATPAPAPTKAPEPTKAPAPTSAPAAQPTAAPTKAPLPTQPPVAPTAVVKAASKYKEAPALAELVKAGKLPPVDQRLPDDPFVVKPQDKIGKYGGKLSSVVADPTGDLMEIEGSMGRGLAGRPFDLQTIVPWAAKSWKLSDDRKELQIAMRKGLKWSDGKPLTTADVKFWYADVFLNTDLTPKIDGKWAPGGKPMEISVSDDYSFSIKFAAAYPAILDFLPNLTPWAPKHHLSQWHIKHNDKANELAKSEKFDTWVQAYQFHSAGSQQQQDVKMPTLNPWAYEKSDTQGNRTYARNPYYWMVDTDGNQLPYTDAAERIVVENKEVLTAKVVAGEGTHHSWFLSLANYPLYKQNEAKGNYITNLYPDLRASECGFCFNYTHKDEVLRKLFNELKWRQAMSHAINRDEINELRFAGQGVPRNPIMHPGATGYKEGMDQYYTKFDVAKANQLLDEIGLKWDADKKFRLRPDGKPFAMTMEVDAGRADLAEVCNLIKGYWAKVGINISVKGQDQQFFMQRMRANDHDIGVWAIGGSSEVYSRQNEPIRYRPPWHWTSTPLGGPLWRQWFDTSGKEGLEPPDIIKKLWDVSEQWRQEPLGSDKYKALAEQMLQINAENCWCIGTVGLVPRVGIVKNTVRNGPKKGQILSIEYNTWTYYLPEHWWIEG
ncbi:MAG: ABC transporter substrate-binding protein [Chloroflexi bacterium]|nr:ABC transporter substrate-binding protein [Chloroflexota bacterium]